MRKKDKEKVNGVYSKRIRPLTVLMLLVISCTVLLCGGWYYDAFGKSVENSSAKSGEDVEELESGSAGHRKIQEEKEAEIEKDGIYIGYDFQGDDITATGKDDIVDALLAAQEAIGIFSTEEEYELAAVSETEDFDIYTFRQYYAGIEVYGHVLKLRTDKSGRVELLNSGYVTIESCDTENKISEGEAQENAEQFLQQDSQFPEGAEIRSYGEIIYFSENDEPLIGYLFHVYVGDVTVSQVLVDGASGNVAGSYDMLQYDMVKNVRMQGQKVEQTLDAYQESEDTYVLKDEDRNIYCYEINRKKDWLGRDKNGDVVLATYERSEEKKQDGGNLPTSLVDALANLQRTYDYFFESYGRQGTDGKNGELEVWNNYIAYNKNGNMIYDNAAWGDSNGKSGAIGICPKRKAAYTDSQWLDIMAHEFAHGIVYEKSKLGESVNFVNNDRQKSEQQAVNEGIADIFGELVEDWSDGQATREQSDENVYNNSCNWVHGADDAGRDIRDCENGNELLTDISKYQVGETECHDASTLVSYPAYLMTQGIDGKNQEKVIGTKLLGNLWYNAIDSLHNASGFRDLRFAVEMQAYCMNLQGEMTDGQMECVIDAFDRVGIEPSCALFKVTPESYMTVFGKDNQKYQKCHIRIEKKGKTVVDEDVAEGACKLNNLKPGIYRVVLTDLENKNLEKSFWILVNDNDSKAKVKIYEKTWDVYTEFGSKQEEAALIIDVSGSMEGTPMEEIQKSARNFVDVVLKENPAARISLIVYETEASLVAESSGSRQELFHAIDNIGSNGGTNMYDALKMAEEVLDGKEDLTNIIVLMSDGEPNEGETDEEGSFETPLIRLSDKLKENGCLLYTFGFYHNLAGDELETCRTLMETMASEGYAYEVLDADKVTAYFGDVASQVSGEAYTYIKLACPVDVTVTKDGETLSSQDASENTRTAWGTLSYQGDNKEDKVLRLLDDDVYEICIAGTGSGTMDYTIGFVDEEGEYSDMRTFEDIPITPSTTISTDTVSEKKTALKMDGDGDGKFERQYTAGADQMGSIAPNTKLLYICAAFLSVLLVVLAVKILVAVKRFQANRICKQCKAAVSSSAEYCGACGAVIIRKRLFLPPKAVRRKQHKAVWITKLTVIGICMVLWGGVYLLKDSAADTVFNQIRNQAYETGGRLYQVAVSDSVWNKLYLSMELEHYLVKTQQAYEAGICGKEDVQRLYAEVSELRIGNVSDKAEEYLSPLEAAE